MSTQGLNADLPSPDGFDGTHGVAPKMWFIVDIPQLHIKLSKKRRKALKMQNIPKMENVRASSPHILHFSILTVLSAAKSTNMRCEMHALNASLWTKCRQKENIEF